MTPEALPVAEPSMARTAPDDPARRSSVRRDIARAVAIFGLCAVAACLVSPLVGTTPVSWARALDRSIPFAENVDAQILLVARLPRVMAGAIVGAALASAGVVFQALLRNPLATPFTLGVSAGASLGAMLVIMFGAAISIGPWSAVPLASLIGAGLAAALVYWLATAPGRPLSTAVLLLAGVTLNAFLSALILFAQHLADFTQVYRAARWLMGDLDIGSLDAILAVTPLVVVAGGLFCLLPSALNLLSLGSDAAAARGLDVARANRLAFLSASLATSAAVALAGPIGFVGIVVPHLVRLLVGVDHRVVLPASALFGAAFLVVCDMVARTATAPVEIPVGVITALVGGPFFLWLLVRDQSR